MSSEGGFTLIELLVVIVIIGILATLSLPAALTIRAKAQVAAAQGNVRTAIPAAESFYTVGNTYTGITGATLRGQAPGIAQTVKAGANATGTNYCIQDTEGGSTYRYDQGANATVEVG